MTQFPVAAILAIGVLAGCGPDRMQQSSNLDVLTRPDVFERLGEPSAIWEGHYGIPGHPLADEYPNATSARWNRRDGAFYLTFETGAHNARVVSSSWLPKGGAF